MSIPSYHDYKSTHIDWLERIPRHWKLKSLKYCITRLGSGGTPETKQPEYWADEEDGDGLPWVSIGDMSNTEIVLHTQKRLTLKGLASKGLEIFNAGSLLYSIYATLGKVATLGVDAAFNQAILAIEPNPQITTQAFLSYWLRSLEAHLDYYASSNTQANLNAAKVLSYPVAVPSHEEQLAIANFLDCETAKIDALIAEQHCLIELLQEKRQAVISHAVTKGLNPDAPMKDSGVEWLGEVPEHWVTGKLCYYARLDTGSTPDRQRPEYWNGDIPWVKTGEVRYEDIYETEERITELAIQETSCGLQQPGTLLMALYGQGVTRGRVGMLMTAASCNQACAAITPSTSIDGRYLELYLTNAYSHLRSLGNETTQQNLNLDFVGKLELLVPPLAEQERIWQTTKQRTKELDALLLQSADAIVLLGERRSALISAAVTGQIDVRGIVPEASAQ